MDCMHDDNRGNCSNLASDYGSSTNNSVEEGDLDFLMDEEMTDFGKNMLYRVAGISRTELNKLFHA